MAITASEQPLSRVFTSDYRFVVPSFQRAYQWRCTQIQQLMNDIMDACGAQNGPYFLGSLILVREHDNIFAIIDGQQRLVSLSILFAVLLELEDDPQLRESLRGLLVETGDKLRGIIPEPRLTLRDRDAEFFREYVQNGDLEALFDLRETDCETQAQRNMLDNTRCAYNELAKMNADERRLFATYLVNEVMLVIVTTDDLSGAYRIFDVMNMRGLPLTASDVFKANVVSHISDGARDVYAQYWDDIMEPMGDQTTAIEAFFADLHLIMTRQPMCEQLLTDFNHDVLSKYLSKGNAIDFVEQVLRPYVTAWQIIEHPADTILPEAAIDLLVGLNDYPSTDWKPVAMWAIVHSLANLSDPDAQIFRTSAPKHSRGVDAGLHDERRLIEILQALDRVTGIDSLNGETSLHRRKRACIAVRLLDKGTPLQRINGFMVANEEQRAAMMHLRGELTISDDMKRLLLVRANEQMAQHRIERPRRLNAVRLLPEHISAQSSFAQWPTDQTEYWVDRIGNFVLTQAKAENIDKFTQFADRKEQLLRSASSRRFPLTQDVAQLADLTPNALRTRQEETVRLIAQSWNIRYDEHHTDLTTVDETTLSAGTTHRVQPNAKRVTIAEVVRAGLLAAGEVLVWDRPRKHEHWEVTVTAKGLLLPDGREVSTPTAAAKALSRSGAKLDVWHRASDGVSLTDIWKRYRQSH